MKKSLIIVAALALATGSAFAQGNVSFGGTLRGIANNTNNTVGLGTYTWTAGAVDVTLLFAPASTTSALTALGIVGGPNAGDSATNGAPPSYSVAQAWAALGTDTAGSWQYLNGAGAANTVLASITGSGTFTYNGGSGWAAGNWLAGTTYSVYELAWFTGGGAYTTPALAGANDAWVGWSKIVQYTPTSGVTQPVFLNAANLGFFGVGGTPVPEPATFALAGLGGLAMLMFRRRN
jgi:hypothetical protein